MKTTQELINDVLLPIQINLVDTNKVYVLLGIGDTDIDKEWPLPSGNAPGNYRCYGEDQLPKYREFDKKIRVYTISGLLWGNSSLGAQYSTRLQIGKLYRAEICGESEKLTADDFIAYLVGTDRAKYIADLDKIYRYIPLGLSGKKARLQSEVSAWTVYTLKSFGIDCADRVYQNWVKRSQQRSPIFEFMIKLTKAEISDECGESRDAIDSLTGIKNNKLQQMNFIQGKRNELMKATQEVGSKYIGEAIEAAERGNFFKAASVARVDTGFWQDKEFYSIRDDYQFPKGYDHEFNDFLFRTYMKKELDWQVTHLNNLLREK